MKNCPNCNVQLEDDVLLCPECGANLEPQEEPAKECPLKKVPKKFLIIGGIVGAVVLALIVSLLLTLMGPKAIARKYTYATLKGNAKQYVSCMPSFMWDDKDEKKEIIEQYQKMFDDRDDEYKQFVIQKIVVQRYTKDEREDIEDYIDILEKTIDNLDEGKIKSKTFRKVTVLVTYKDEDGVSYADTLELVVFKYKGQWKVFSLGGLFGSVI